MRAMSSCASGGRSRTTSSASSRSLVMGQDYSCGRSASKNPRSSERLKGNDCSGVVNAGDGLHFLIDEVADIGSRFDVEFDQQVKVAGGRVDLRRDLRVGERVRDCVGFAEIAL